MPDLDELLCELPRGRRGAFRICLRTEGGSPEFLDLRHYYPTQDGELKSGHGVRIAPSEAMAVAAALMTFARTQTAAARNAALAKKAERPRRPAPQQRTLPGTFRQPQDDNVGAVSEEERRLAEEIF